MQPPQPEKYLWLYEIGKYLLLPALLGIASGIRWMIERFSDRKEKAQDQLERLFKLLADQVERKELRAKQSEVDYRELDEALDLVTTKLREARGELIDVRGGIVQIRKLHTFHNIEDENLTDLVEELHSKLTVLVEALKPEKHLKAGKTEKTDK